MWKLHKQVLATDLEAVLLPFWRSNTLAAKIFKWSQSYQQEQPNRSRLARELAPLVSLLTAGSTDEVLSATEDPMGQVCRQLLAWGQESSSLSPIIVRNELLLACAGGRPGGVRACAHVRLLLRASCSLSSLLHACTCHCHTCSATAR